jgi:hypothetical protein
MNKSAYVRIRKLAASANPAAPTPDMKDYRLGEENPGLSLPVDYEIEGELRHDIAVGQPISALRYKRNGVEVTGIFASSAVVSITQSATSNIVATANSIYLVDTLGIVAK